MALQDHKITAWTNPIVGEADRPQRSASSMKAVFDSNSNQLKDSFNGLIDDLAGDGGIDLLGTSQVPGIAGTTLSEQLESLKEYTDQTVIAVGAGDMAKGIYDPTHKERDIFAYTDSAVAPKANQSDLLLKADKSVERTGTLLSTGWTGSGPYTQTVSVSGVTAADKPIIDVVLSSGTETAIAELEAWGMVSKIETGAGSITATCLEEQPEVDLNLQIKVVG